MFAFVRSSICVNLQYLSTGEHKDEGDHGKRAENETTSAGVTQSPEGKTFCVSLFYSLVSQFLCLFPSLPPQSFPLC